MYHIYTYKELYKVATYYTVLARNISGQTIWRICHESIWQIFNLMNLCSNVANRYKSPLSVLNLLSLAFTRSRSVHTFTHLLYLVLRKDSTAYVVSP